MDAQFWIYIVIGVIYFLSRLLKKPEQTPGEASETQTAEKRIPRQNAQVPDEKPRPLTFEELLREITEGKEAQRRQPEPVSTEYESYEKDLGDEAPSLEEVNFDEAENAEKWKPYEEVPVRPFGRTSLEETLRLQDTVVDFRKFDAFQQQTQRKLLDDYTKILRNPATLKQAVVLSEILKRKF